jgi:putative Holliday junction resolvase
MRYLGVDYGARRIGLAVSDPEGKVAMPHSVVTEENPKAQVAQVAEVARAAGVEAVVVGRPVGLSGEAGPAEKKVHRFAGRLSSLALRVVLWDERFTTHGARHALQQLELDAREQRPVIDQVAATLMLQSYLDHMNSR